ncbi:MBL fold metallo-hydrolase [Candidatus Woesearchaeota archaeon]|jgi:putative mRNA 3-end processing factor|nr:MBL fold metallo-hydrolase [Candidatus Woesearchaeota archaeon]
MKLTFHGGAREVGRSCVELDTGRTKVLFDSGIMIEPEGTAYPINLNNLDQIDAVFLSHAHVDHSGALPYLDHNGLNCPIFCTKVTKNICRLLLTDSFKVGKLSFQDLGYEKNDIYKALDFMRRVKLREEGTIGDLDFTFYDAGHIPGSTSILVETSHSKYKKIFYTGDIKASETCLLNPPSVDVKRDLSDVDVLITETTYGNRIHSPRRTEVNRFLKVISTTLARGGNVLIPVFAVGRAQEILLMLAENVSDYDKMGINIYLDGMAKKATEIMLACPETLKDSKKLQKMFNKAIKVDGKMRKKVLRRQSIIVTTSGMLTGGAILSYLKETYKNNRDSILLTGYQAEATNGRLLMEEGCVYIDGHRKKVNCQLDKFDFSAHSDQAEIKDLIRNINPKKLILMHGDPEALNEILEWAKVKEYDVCAPSLGETIDLGD